MIYGISPGRSGICPETRHFSSGFFFVGTAPEDVDISHCNLQTLGPDGWMSAVYGVVRSIVHRFTVEAHNAMEIFQQLQKPKYVAYHALDAGLKDLWLQ